MQGGYGCLPDIFLTAAQHLGQVAPKARGLKAA